MSETKPMSMIAALNSAIDALLAADEKVVHFGEDAGYFGGVFGVTAGLQEKYGLHRVFDAPINEGAIAAMAIGMAANDLKPIAEARFLNLQIKLQRTDFFRQRCLLQRIAIEGIAQERRQLRQHGVRLLAVLFEDQC